MTFKSYLCQHLAGMYWNFDTHKGIPMKIRFAFGIDRWVDHKWKESLVLISGDIGNRFAGVNQLGVVF
jgi:hypothetical protein